MLAQQESAQSQLELSCAVIVSAVTSVSHDSNKLRVYQAVVQTEAARTDFASMRNIRSVHCVAIDLSFTQVLIL